MSQTIRDLGLLPRNDEQREYWFQRVKRYEKKNGIDIAELVERNQIRKFGGVLNEDRVASDSDSESEDKKKEESINKITWKPVKRKPARGTKDKRAPPPIVEKVYEKRAVFLEGHKSSGWVSGDSTWQHQHGLDFDADYIEEGQVAHVIHGNHFDDDDDNDEGDASRDSGSEDVDDKDDGDYDHDGDDDYDYVDEDEDEDEDDDDDSTAGTSSLAHIVKHAHRGKKVRSADHGLPKTIFSRDPEKRRDVFHSKDRHGDLYIPPPLETLFPEVIGTGMATMKYRTRETQTPFYEDPYRFGKTQEEIAAMDALQDL